jgi:putative hydrolase of the HAD superfamily
VGSPQHLLADFIEHGFATCEWLEGAEEALAWCRSNGIRSGVITNGPSSMQRAKLRSLQMTERVDIILVSGEEGVAKPETAIFHRAAERLGVSPERCVFVGDNPVADVDGARRAGMLDIWIERHVPWPAELAAPSHSITSLASLPSLLSLSLLPARQHRQRDQA